MQTTQATGTTTNSAGMDSAELLKTLLANEHIPERIVNQLWALFSNTLKLTFLTENDVQRFLLMFKLIRLTIIESLPKGAYNEELELSLLMVRIEYESNLRKSLGGKMNYIEIISSNVQATFDERPLISNTSDNVSFVKRLATNIKAVIS